MSKETAKV
jgi:sodium/potassium-transporting ATPase subunit alpha